jgi:hypothetical protein
MSFPMLVALAFMVPGCSSSSTEIPATKEAAPTMSQQQSMDKAMQGMPPEMRAKMEAMKPKQPQ